MNSEHNTTHQNNPNKPPSEACEDDRIFTRPAGLPKRGNEVLDCARIVAPSQLFPFSEPTTYLPQHSFSNPFEPYPCTV